MTDKQVDQIISKLRREVERAQEAKMQMGVTDFADMLGLHPSTFVRFMGTSDDPSPRRGYGFATFFQLMYGLGLNLRDLSNGFDREYYRSLEPSETIVEEGEKALNLFLERLAHEVVVEKVAHFGSFDKFARRVGLSKTAINSLVARDEGKIPRTPTVLKVLDYFHKDIDHVLTHPSATKAQPNQKSTEAPEAKATSA